jgi:hypothetical protein
MDTVILCTDVLAAGRLRFLTSPRPGRGNHGNSAHAAQTGN